MNEKMEFINEIINDINIKKQKIKGKIITYYPEGYTRGYVSCLDELSAFLMCEIAKTISEDIAKKVHEMEIK